jgi:hypothetical protein
MPVKKPVKASQIDVVKIKTARMTVCILGKTPLILHRLSQKAWHELLAPSKKKNAAERATTLKHDPIQEFRDAPYLAPDNSSDTYVRHLATAFKASLRNAALDIPGATKAQLGRLTYVEGEWIDIYGIPKLFMAITRNSDMARTPDVRTRAIMPEWACKLNIAFTEPMLSAQTVSNLLAAAGVINGVGDWRPQKGSGTYGQFEIVNEDNKDFQRIIGAGGYDAQVAAMKRAEPYDSESAEMIEWFREEMDNRGMKIVS